MLVLLYGIGESEIRVRQKNVCNLLYYSASIFHWVICYKKPHRYEREYLFKMRVSATTSDPPLYWNGYWWAELHQRYSLLFPHLNERKLLLVIGADVLVKGLWRHRQSSTNGRSVRTILWQLSSRIMLRWGVCG